MCLDECHGTRKSSCSSFIMSEPLFIKNLLKQSCVFRFTVYFLFVWCLFIYVGAHVHQCGVSSLVTVFFSLVLRSSRFCQLVTIYTHGNKRHNGRSGTQAHQSIHGYSKRIYRTSFLVQPRLWTKKKLYYTCITYPPCTLGTQRSFFIFVQRCFDQ